MHLQYTEDGKFVEVDPPAAPEEKKSKKDEAKPQVKDEELPSNQRIHTNLGEFVPGQTISVLPHQEEAARNLIANTAEKGSQEPKASGRGLEAKEAREKNAETAANRAPDAQLNTEPERPARAARPAAAARARSVTPDKTAVKHGNPPKK